MPTFAPIPLGQPIPASPHAVSCSLPTMQAVHGYEQKDPAITGRMTSGYPRFVVHPFLQQLAAHYRAAAQLGSRPLWLVSSPRMAAAVHTELQQAGAEGTLHDFDGIAAVSHADTPELCRCAKTLLQNTGGFLSSRAAEDRLVQLGLLAAPHPEKYYPDDALNEVRRQLQPLFAGTTVEDILPAACGINALHVALDALADKQAARGRTVWIQVGWLYLDTIALLRRRARTPADYIHLHDVFDLPALELIFAQHGARIAGLVIEAPTNPLLQTPDLAAIARLARAYDAAVLIDPSVSSVYSVDVLPHADVVVASLTKYCASEGDLMAGLVVVNPRIAGAAELRREIKSRLEPVYPRDLARLAHEIGATRQVLRHIETTVPLVAAWLEAHAGVKQVIWSLSSPSRANYERIARTPGSVGSMISFTVKKPLAEVFDRLRLPKGPSFGMKTTLICPFIYLAHYELATTPAGRAELAANGIDPDLLRLSIGTEPAQDIITALAEALG